MAAFCRYVIARYKREAEETAYRVYLTDGLKAITENTARFAGGTIMQRRYIDLIAPKPEDNRTGEQIVEDVTKKLGLKIKKKEVNADGCI